MHKRLALKQVRFLMKASITSQSRTLGVLLEALRVASGAGHGLGRIIVKLFIFPVASDAPDATRGTFKIQL